MTKSSYDVLGVNRNTTENDVKMAYRRLAKKYHPDVNKSPDATQKFIEIDKAYKNLLNPKEFDIDFWINYIFRGVRVSGVNKYKESTVYFYGWEELVKWEDFDDGKTNKRDIINSRERYGYNWAYNKTNYLYKIYRKILDRFTCRVSTKFDNSTVKDIIRNGIEDVINHLNRVLAKEIDIKEKIKKPINPFKETKGYYPPFYQVRSFQNLIYDVMNQYHPKFLDKLPMRVQTHINKKIENMIFKLQVELEKIPPIDVWAPKFKKGTPWNKTKTPIMVQFEKETGKHTIWNGKITGNFEFWLWQREKKKNKKIKNK